ncbi:mobilome CxxCx(11)CxxC protein [Pseudomonas sp. NFX15]|uniref:mobilome CxxCx(11)CxxC protein n=1 Tax=Pseudomonas sp. NFX15 TaxID=2816958 RepID=UPI003B8CD313
MNERVVQTRTDALVAEYIYSKKLNRIGVFTTCISLLTIIVPVMLSAALLVAKNSTYENLMNMLSIFTAAALLSLSILALILRIDQKRESYLIGRRSNIYVGNESLKLINDDDSKLAWFYNYLVEMDSKDQENIGNVSSSLKKEAYRYSLKKLFPGQNHVVCSICKASPFIFKKGICQVCGNTPKE